MKKLIFITFTSLCLLSNGILVGEAAAPEKVTAEKAWTIELNSSVLNTEENLKKVVVKAENGNIVDAEIRVNVTKPSVIEVLPNTILSEGTYEVIVEKGFKSKSSLETLTNYTELFTVISSMETADLKGTWTTEYSYEGARYNISSTYNNGVANLTVTGNNFNMTGPEKYSLSDGYMNMEIKSFNMKLSGTVKVFDENKFLVISPGGKEAIFSKIK